MRLFILVGFRELEKRRQHTYKTCLKLHYRLKGTKVNKFAANHLSLSLLLELTFFAVAGQLNDVPKRQKVLFPGNSSQKLLQFRVHNVQAGAAVLAAGVMVVRGKNFAEFDLAFKAMPNAIDDAQVLEQADGAVGCGSIDGRRTGSRQMRRSGGAFAQQLLEDGLSGQRVAVAGVFQYFFEAVNHMVQL